MSFRPASFNPYPGTNPYKVMAYIVFGGSAACYLALLGTNHEVKDKVFEETLAHHPVGAMNTNRDAFSVSARPAKNSNVKGSLPQAHRW